MSDENINELTELIESIESDIQLKVNELIRLLENESIENINLYNFYLEISDLLSNKKTLENKIINYYLMK